MTNFQRLQTTSADGTQLQLYRWNETGDVNIFLIHGYGSHAQRLSDIAKRLASLGYRVTALDLRGHGQSEGKQGVIDIWLRYTEDILAAIATLRKPFFAIAQGSGALSMLSTMQGSITPRLEGIILANPLLGIIQKPSLSQRLILKTLSKLPLPLQKQKSFRWDQLAFDSEICTSYQHDPLCFSRTSLAFVQQMLMAQQQTLSYAQQYHYPLLMLRSPNDSISDQDVSQHFYQQYAGKKGQYEYLRSAHLLLEDQEKELVVQDIHTWISKQRQR